MSIVNASVGHAKITVTVHCFVCQHPWTHTRGYDEEPADVPGQLLHEGWFEAHAVIDGRCTIVLICSANCASLLEERRRVQYGRMTEDEINRLHEEE